MGHANIEEIASLELSDISYEALLHADFDNFERMYKLSMQDGNFSLSHEADELKDIALEAYIHGDDINMERMFKLAATALNN